MDRYSLYRGTMKQYRGQTARDVGDGRTGGRDLRQDGLELQYTYLGLIAWYIPNVP